MIKRVIHTIFILLLFSCVTSREDIDFVETTETKPLTPTTVEPTPPTPTKDSPTRDVLLELDDEIREIVVYLSKLVIEKEWEELALLTDELFYSSYILESGGTFIDYMMFMLHTGEEGNATSNSLNSITNIQFTDLIDGEKKIELTGNFIYKNNEEEYFKMILLIDDGFIITRD